MGTTSKTTHRFYLYDNRDRKFREIQNGTTYGREEVEASSKKDGLVSRRHCRFDIVGNDVYIEDVGSTNRTRINSVAIQTGRKRRLRLNDVIEIGKQRLILTNQTIYPPSHTQDSTLKTKGIVALEKSDGSITRFMPSKQNREQNQRTLLLLKRSDFQQIRKARKKNTLVPKAPKKNHTFKKVALILLASSSILFAFMHTLTALHR